MEHLPFSRSQYWKTENKFSQDETEPFYVFVGLGSAAIDWTGLSTLLEAGDIDLNVQILNF